MEHLERTRALRADTGVHYNCCQSILVPFAEEIGLTEERAYALGAHFGSGMRHGGTCGALSGTLMVLGLLGYDEKQAAALVGSFRQAHGATHCAALLKASHDRGIPRKQHCDGLVFEMVEALDRLLKEREGR